MKYLFAAVFSFSFGTVLPQSAARLFPPVSYPQDYFRDPLDIPMSLAANFGELRPNHYHMGLDIRTQRRENLPVHAAADGYVYRVEIEPEGFGQAIYIRHPNGYTTVYGHLNRFFPALAAYIREQQYRQQSWQTDLLIPPALFPVKKGDLIAYSGNTGGSQGPHLHFEIRLSAGDINLNPLLFGLPVPDNTPPAIVRLAWYDGNQGIYEQSPHLLPVASDGFPSNRLHVAAEPASVAATGWKIAPSLLTVPTTRISFAISAFDAQSGSNNPNGIYQAVLYEDDLPVIGFELNHISYDHTRNINAHIDYKTRVTGGPFLQQLFFLPGYPFPSIYRIFPPSGAVDPAAGSGDSTQRTGITAHPPDGVLDLSDGRPHRIRIDVLDTHGNVAELKLTVQYRSSRASVPAVVSAMTGKKFYPGMVDGLEMDDCAFYLAEKSLYDSAVIGMAVSGYPGSGLSLPGGLSPVCSIGARWIPLLDRVLIRLRYPARSAVGTGEASSVPVSKIVMVCFQGSEKDVQLPEWQNGWASARFREFGDFQLVYDSLPPTILPIGPLEGADLGHASRIAFTVKDNLGAWRNFRAELDGSWLCFTNDKGLAYIYTFDEHCPPGPHTLKVSVEDIAGNRTEKEYHFTR